MKKTRAPIRSQMGWSDPDRILVRGHDLCGEVIGVLNLGDMAYLELMGRLPSVNESKMFNAILVTLVEHGLTPMAIVSRLTYLGAPEALQSAVAAGLCGVGSTFAGTAEGAARLLHESISESGDRDLDALAASIVERHRSTKRPIPGIGHNLHKPQDPRAVRLFSLAAELGYSGPYVTLMQKIADVASDRLGRDLPVNATGAIGAICCELEIPWKAARGIAVMGRAIGLVGHLVEEQSDPIAQEIWLRADEEAHQNYGQTKEGNE